MDMSVHIPHLLQNGSTTDNDDYDDSGFLLASLEERSKKNHQDENSIFSDLGFKIALILSLFGILLVCFVHLVSWRRRNRIRYHTLPALLNNYPHRSHILCTDIDVIQVSDAENLQATSAIEGNLQHTYVGVAIPLIQEVSDV